MRPNIHALKSRLTIEGYLIEDGLGEVWRLPADQNSGSRQIKNPHDFRDELGGIKIPSPFLEDRSKHLV